MAPDETPPDQVEPAEPAPRRRRVVFPWVWIALVVGARIAFGFADVTVDFFTIATLGSSVLLLVGLALWYAFRGWGSLVQRLLIAAAPFVAIGTFYSFYEFRFNGAGEITGFHRRALQKQDQRLAQLEDAAGEEGLADWGPGEFDYPRFLGEGAWAESVGPAIATDWDNNPPVELWRREVGAGWSAFAVYGPYAVTQEQRGDQELVVCYRARTGEPVWSHADPVRFDPEDLAGQMGRQGPRATPTIVGDRVYTQGATGLVNCLDGRTGEALWSVDTAEAYGSAVAVWGKSGSPCYAPAGEGIDRDLVLVNVGAPASETDGYAASLVAFDAATGDEVWSAGSRQTSYASPQVIELHGERVVLQTCDDLLEGRRLADGSRLFEFPWSGTSENMPSCSQPIDVGENRVLLTKGYGHGSSLFGVVREGEDWSLEPLWSPPIQRVLQTKYSNPVVHDGYAYALNGEMLQCVEVATGESQWRKRRRPKFGFGQVLLVGDHVLVMCEESGEVVLVEANPERYRETASMKVLAEGEVCWNNPVVAGDLLLVRNAVEAAAYRLPLAGEAEAETPLASR